MITLLRKYGVQATIDFILIKPDGVDHEGAATFVAGDIKIMKDEGVEANTTNLPVDEGQGYSLVLTAAELQAKRITGYVVDLTATKVWLDTAFVIETYGNASAQHPFDLGTAAATMRGTDAALLAASAPTNFGSLGISAGGLASADLKQILAAAPPVTNLSNQYDGTTGLAGDLFPATQAQVGNLAVGTAAISTIAESIVLTTGTLLGGVLADTETVNGVEHQHNDAAGTLDLYYQFDVTSNGIPVTSTVIGRANGNNDSLTVSAFNWSGSSWDQVGTLVGNNGSTNAALTLDLLTRHVGTGVNLGKVRIRFNATGLTSATLSVDQITVAFASIAQTGVLETGILQAATANTATLAATANATDGFFNNAVVIIMSGTGAGQARIIPDYVGATKVATITPAWTVVPNSTSQYDIFSAVVHAATTDLGYENGQVYIDTVGGTAGTLIGVNGVASKPSLTLADADVIRIAKNLGAFHLAPGASIVLVANSSNLEFVGRIGTIDFGSQLLTTSLVASHFITGTVNAASIMPTFQRCIIKSGGLATPPGNFFNCSIMGTITCNADGTYSFINCSSLLPGSAAPVLNVAGNGTIARQFNIRHYSGGIEVQNLTSVDVISLEGNGQLIINANCIGGSISRRGSWKLTDNSGGAVTLLVDDNASNISAILTDTGTTLSAQITALNNFDPATDPVATVTNLTNLPAIPAGWLTATGIATAALDGKGDWNINKTGYSISGTITTLDGLNNLDAATVNAQVDAALDTLLPVTPTAGSLNDKVKANLNATVSSRMAEASINTTAGAVDNVTLVATTTTNTDMRGTDGANTTAPDNTSIAAILADTADMQPKLGAPSVSLAADIAAIPTTPLTSVLAESYATDGAAFTAAQALYQIWSSISERSITGTTQTSRKLDGITAAMTHTLDDATTPTSITRAT